MTRYFTKDHEWLSVEGAIATIGITDFAQAQLGDVVFVELPVPGRKLKAGSEAAVVESVKAASEVFAPASGEVIAVNTAIVDDPSMVNSSPEGEGWFFKLKLSAPAELAALMDEAAYQALTKGL